MKKQEKIITLLVVLIALSTSLNVYYSNKALSCYNLLDSQYIVKSDKQHDSLINYIKWSFYLNQGLKEQARESYDQATELESQITRKIGLDIIAISTTCRNYSNLSDIFTKITLIFATLQLLFIMIYFKK